MKKIILYVLLNGLVIFSTSVFAQSKTAKGISEVEQLGISAGVATACQVDKDDLADYEMIASRIIANPLKTDDAEKAALTLYAKAKLKAYEEQKKKNTMNCPEVLSRFHKQKIFKSRVYQDGTVELPNGTILKPSRPVMKIPHTKKAKKPKINTLKSYKK